MTADDLTAGEFLAPDATAFTVGVETAGGIVVMRAQRVVLDDPPSLVGMIRRMVAQADSRGDG